MAQETLVRVRGGLKGFRMITLDQWKNELKARRGKIVKAKRRRDERMETKQKRRNKRRAKKKVNP